MDNSGYQPLRQDVKRSAAQPVAVELNGRRTDDVRYGPKKRDGHDNPNMTRNIPDAGKLDDKREPVHDGTAAEGGDPLSDTTVDETLINDCAAAAAKINNETEAVSDQRRAGSMGGLDQAQRDGQLSNDWQNRSKPSGGGTDCSYQADYSGLFRRRQ